MVDTPQGGIPLPQQLQMRPEYMVIHAQELSVFVKVVNQALAQRWQPVGGIAIGIGEVTDVADVVPAEENSNGTEAPGYVRLIGIDYDEPDLDPLMEAEIEQTFYQGMIRMVPIEPKPGFVIARANLPASANLN